MSKKKINLFLIISLLIFLTSFIRIYYLNIIKDNYYNKRLKDKTKIIIEGPSPLRGRILDRNGNVLVDNRGVKTIIYTKIRGISINEEIDIAYKLADILDIEKEIKKIYLKQFYKILHLDKVNNKISKKEYQKFKERKLTLEDLNELKIKRITDKDLETFNDIDKKAAYIYYLMNKGYSYEEKIIEEDVSEEVYAKISEEKIKGVRGEITWVRSYPQGDTLRTLFGNVSENGVPKELKKYYIKNGYKLNDKVGISYLEKQYEKYLKGKKAKYLVNKDNTLTKIQDEEKGNDLYLSIDINLQKKIDDMLKEQISLGKKKTNTEYYNHSYVIVGNPQNGEIYALSGIQKLGKTNENHYRDLSTSTFTSSYTVGSVVKGATIAVGYNNNLINDKTVIYDSCVKLYSNPRKCSFKRLGRINDEKALSMSSNYFQYLIAIGITGNKYRYNMKLNPTIENFNEYRNTLKTYGLGAKTEIDIPNEVEGIKGSKINGDLLLNLSIGQYDTYTPVQLLQYINTIATSKRIKLSLMKEVKDNKNNIILQNDSKILNTINLSENYQERVKEGLKKVFISGTGKGYVNTIYKPAGKTGTAQSFLDTDFDKKIDTETISSSLVMYAPFDNPKISMVVMSPNVSHKSGRSDYMAFINKSISKEAFNIINEVGYY